MMDALYYYTLCLVLVKWVRALRMLYSDDPD